MSNQIKKYDLLYQSPQSVFYTCHHFLRELTAQVLISELPLKNFHYFQMTFIDPFQYAFNKMMVESIFSSLRSNIHPSL